MLEEILLISISTGFYNENADLITIGLQVLL